ncbi:Protein RRP5 like [Pseudolycoriella hygida]|uniref:Protein RRP5 like n=1 Tax=Pseudolycoriella hygida TaxID=35572 RepID=A0A9Q0RXA1_9DIPT|nr:Protein RRP5 like [Pseudolycoriella hygida]
MVFVETSFPRGGVSKPVKESAPIENANIEFGAATFKRKKEKPNKKQRTEKRKKDNEERHTEQIEANSAELLSYRTVTEGMTIMGCVSKIETTYLEISLPGRLTGQVNVKNISASYVNILNQMLNDIDNVEGYKSLEEMFTLGQIVCVRVMNVKSSRSGAFGISLSMIPAEIQSEFHHKNVGKGMLLSVAVEGIEDHGYVIETGIKNLRGFLPIANSSEQLGVGQVVFCRVEDMKSASAASTAILSIVDSDLKKLKHMKEPNLSYILPTTIVKFKVTKILNDGLQGSLMNDTFTAYINEHQFGSTSSSRKFKENEEIDARVLYVMPITKLVYLSLNLNDSIAVFGDELKIGDVVDKAKVIRIGTGGVILKLNESARGLVSLKSLKSGVKANFDRDEVLQKYHKNSFHRARIVAYDPMDSLYICAVNEKIVDEKFFSVVDVEVGDYVEARIIRQLKDGAIQIKVGNIRGYIEKVHISPATPAKKLVRDAKLRTRVIRKSVKNNKIFLTNRKELMASDSLLLKSYEKAVVGLEYHGMIVKIFGDGFLVSFCQYVKGMLFKKNLSELDMANTAKFFHEGQISKFRIMNVSKENITLGLGDFISQTGTILDGKISIVSPNSLQVAFSNNKISGIVPSMFLTKFPSLVPILINTYKVNEAVTAVSINQDIYSIRDVDCTHQVPVKHWKEIKPGDILTAFVKNVHGEVVDMMCLIEGYDKIVKIHAKMLLQDYERQTNLELVQDQVLHVRVLGLDKTLKTLTCSAKLSEVWDGNLKDTVSIYRQYFVDLQRIKVFCQKSKNPIGNLNVGDTVSATVKNDVAEDSSGCLYVKLSANVEGVLSPHNIDGQPKIGDKIECLIVWIDYVKNCVHLTSKRKYVQRQKEKNYSTIRKSCLYTSRGIKADVLKIVDDFVVLYPRKLTNNLVFVPLKFHYNDLQPIIVDGVKEGDLSNVTIIDAEGDYNIGMFNNIFLKLKTLQPIRSKKRKVTSRQEEYEEYGENMEDMDSDDSIQSEDSDAEEEVELNTEEDELTKKNGKRKLEQEPDGKVKKKPRKNGNEFQIEQLDGAIDMSTNSDEEEIFTAQSKNCVSLPKKKNPSKTAKSTQPEPVLPGVKNFWTATPVNIEKSSQQESSSSEDESDRVVETSAKKRKLTSDERFKMVREEEARIRQIEESYANNVYEPTTVDQFERLVLSQPDDSRNWINYMVFHMQSNETEKARVVARKALNKISYRESGELLNIWVALLNLEFRYGDKSSFDKVLSEALRVNDPFDVYSKCLHIYADCRKIPELCDMVQTVTKKFRAKPEAWTLSAKMFLTVGLEEKAKQLLTRGLKSLPERDHVATIVKFAMLSHKHNQRDYAHTLLEQILSSYPKRVDIWSTYIDMLVKDNEIALSRQVLERATSQNIPVKKMRFIFKKFLDLEEKFGKPEDLAKVKAMAVNYVEKQIKDHE